MLQVLEPSTPQRARRRAVRGAVGLPQASVGPRVAPRGLPRDVTSVVESAVGTEPTCDEAGFTNGSPTAVAVKEDRSDVLTGKVEASIPLVEAE